MKDTQLKKLTRVVRKLAAEVAALRKLIRRELPARDGKGSSRKPRKVKKRKGREKKAGPGTKPEPAPSVP